MGVHAHARDYTRLHSEHTEAMEDSNATTPMAFLQLAANIRDAVSRPVGRSTSVIPDGLGCTA